MNRARKVLADALELSEFERQSTSASERSNSAESRPCSSVGGDSEARSSSKTDVLSQSVEIDSTGRRKVRVFDRCLCIEMECRHADCSKLCSSLGWIVWKSLAYAGEC